MINVMIPMSFPLQAESGIDDLLDGLSSSSSPYLHKTFNMTT